MSDIFHSVRLDADRCKGCTNCIKRCPTQAIRVRDGKASITDKLCIDCGECIRVCPHHAKKPVVTPFAELQSSSFKYKIALPAPSLYCQFNNLNNVDYVLTGLKAIGFDDVFEVSLAAEIVTEQTRKYLADPNVPKPLISSACPAAVRLIETRFPQLCNNLSPFLTPVELAALLARKRAVEEKGFLPEEVGTFFISPCPAKMTAAILHENFDTQIINGVFAMSEVYVPLVSAMNKIKTPETFDKSGYEGASWAFSGGESEGLPKIKYLAADGIDHVISILEGIEDEKISGLDYIELNACSAGCVGGCLVVENPYVAKARMKSLGMNMPTVGKPVELPKEIVPVLSECHTHHADTAIAGDYGLAVHMMNEIKSINEMLPALDCGACGAPSCLALAEDVVCGKAKIEDCIFILREKMKKDYAMLVEMKGIE